MYTIGLLLTAALMPPFLSHACVPHGAGSHYHERETLLADKIESLVRVTFCNPWSRYHFFVGAIFT